MTTSSNKKEKVKIAVDELLKEAEFNAWPDEAVGIECHPDNFSDVSEFASEGMRIVPNWSFPKDTIKIINLSNGNFLTYTFIL
jgi:hypothetical protein